MKEEGSEGARRRKRSKALEGGRGGTRASDQGKQRRSEGVKEEGQPESEGVKEEGQRGSEGVKQEGSEGARE